MKKNAFFIFFMTLLVNSNAGINDKISEKISKPPIDFKVKPTPMTELFNIKGEWVHIYSDNNFGGNFKKIKALYLYPTPDTNGLSIPEASCIPLNQIGSVWNDVISSIRIPDRHKVILFEHDNCQGKNLSLSMGDYSDFIQLNWSDSKKNKDTLNDQISSMIILPNQESSFNEDPPI